MIMTVQKKNYVKELNGNGYFAKEGEQIGTLIKFLFYCILW
jgi:hypothetical protein